MAKDEKESPNYGKALLGYSCVSIIITMITCPYLIDDLGKILVGLAVLFFIYVVFVRIFIVYGRKQ